MHYPKPKHVRRVKLECSCGEVVSILAARAAIEAGLVVKRTFVCPDCEKWV